MSTTDTSSRIAGIGDNSFAMHADETAAVERTLIKLIGDSAVTSVELPKLLEAGSKIDAATAALIRDAGKSAHDHLQALDKSEREMKAPFESQIILVKAGFRPLIARTSILKENARGVLTGFLKEQDRQAQIAAAAAAKAQEEADAAAAAAAAKAQDTGHAFDHMDAVEATYAAEAQAIETEYAGRVASSKSSVGSASGIAKAASLRVTWGANVVDGPKLVRHYAKRQELIDAALKLAAAEMRASKGQATIPGAEAVKTEKAV